MKYLGIEESVLESNKALNTAKEISGQPVLWRKIAHQVEKSREEIGEFLTESFKNTDKVILTGSGTSSYVGIALQGLMFRKFQKHIEVAPATEIVTHPENYFSENTSVMLVSFARSGNSPESVAAVKLADRLSAACSHLIITCDENGALAKYQASGSKYLIVLPPESNDKALAMTGSYTGMLLTGIMLAYIFDLESLLPQIDTLCGYGEKILANYSESLKEISKQPFQRAVFLGSGPFVSTAVESHLKLQELTNGIVICKRDSFLGLRHGPKAVVHENTLVVYIFSNREYVIQYEKDLASTIIKDHNPICQIAISENANTGLPFDLDIRLTDACSCLDEELLAVCYVLPAQMLGFFKSLDLGLTPDSPSKNNVISRVVEGVKIYDFTGNDVHIAH